MPFSSGTFSLYTPGNPVVTGTTIASTWANNTLTDLATGLSTCVLKDGTQTMTANLPMGAFKITGLGQGTAITDAATYGQVAGYGVCQGRLTLTTATAVTTSDVTGASAVTIYFTPYGGDRIGTYSGTAWTVQSFTEKSVSVPATTSTMYDVFIVDSTLALEALAWTSDTARATALTTQNGVLVKTGATTRRYLGSFRTTTVSGQTEDSFAKRYLWNYYNRVPRGMRKTETTDSWNYTLATIRQANGSTSNQLDYIVGVAEVLVRASAYSIVGNTNTGVTVSAGIGLDRATVNDANIKAVAQTQSANNLLSICAHYEDYSAIGRHFLAWTEFSGATGTSTWYGDAGDAADVQAGIFGSLMG